jgi:RNA polymerase sigma factor (sigma-70 family)
MARMYRGPSAVEGGELLQEGVVGLLRALDRYDRSLGTPFWPYASWWVRQAMQHLVAERTRPLVLSDRALRQLARLKQARRAYEQAEGREATAADLSQATGLTREQIDSLSSVDRTPRALEEPLGGDNAMGSVVGDTLADQRAEEAFERVERKLDLEQLHGLSRDLCDRERLILLSHFGIRGPAQTLRQIGSHLGLSAERVRQVEEQALEKLRVAAALRP